ncbi:MAG: diacylglycerol kinase family lipid kinase [Caldilineae bacterium]|nr:diacylglycerol kinase family lipid kinase [Anaerolineae bacterium]MCB0199409.1 diacylglycerol kinase family lipid kinase [Anaerolineae bacterium]MCB0252349.1 diacylglycerol kinase family lipid kinase [Anaerolineae bacterium]MCB9152673.1 diacylglycerol kinase family lipid kinase [Caldilineae bacterium]
MRVLLLYNASAGARTSHRRLPAAIAVLEQAGWQVESTATNTPEHAETLARTAAAAGFDIVAAAGGDGTINVVANGLAMADPDEPAAALGILPAGTGNVLARDLGLPVPVPGVLDMLPEAAHLLVRSRSMAVDLGRVTNAAGQRIFVCWAGVGLDAAITAQVAANPVAKQWLGALAYVASAVGQVREIYHSPLYTVQVDGQQFQGRGVLAVASNIQRYAVVFDMAPNAAMNDGLLDVTFFHDITVFNGMDRLWKLTTAQHIDAPGIGYATGRRVLIDADTPQPVHVDAEPFGATPVTIEILPGAIQLMVPPTVAARRLIKISSNQ